MELGALVCTSKQPRCVICPVRSLCRARGNGIERLVPHAYNRRAVIRHDLVVLLVVRRGKYLLNRLDANGFIPGDWGLPVRVTASPASSKRTARELSDVLGAKGTALMSCGAVVHAILHRRIRAHVFRCEINGAEPGTADTGVRKWVAPPEFRAMVTSSLFHKALRAESRQATKNAKTL
jgi:A/G-specific adenine glycosylase